VAAVHHLQTVAAGGLERQIGHRQRGTRDLDAALVEQYAVLEDGIDLEGEASTRLEVELCAEQGSEGVHGGAVACELTEEDPHGGTGNGARLRHVVGEVATRVTVGVGQRHPQLHTVQDGGGRGGHLGMTDARACRHEIQLAGPHHRVHPGAVAMFHLTAEQPTDGLQSGVRMRRHVHPCAATNVVRTVMVGETPRPDQRPLPLWQRASHLDRPRAAQRHLAWMQHPGERRSHAGDFGRSGVSVAHGLTLAPWAGAPVIADRITSRS
jgi:hypothetical protein